jgi:Protein of unknown function (DUF3617)
MPSPAASGEFVMRSSAIPATLILAGAMICGHAFAVDLPQRKAGLWVVASSSPGGNLPSHEVRMCIDASTDAMMANLGTNMMQGACNKNDIKRDGAVVTVNTVCKVGQMQTSTTAVTHFSGDTAYHTDINTTFNPPMTGQASAVVAQDAKWTGACPADMKPGDMIMPDGTKVNIMSVMNRSHKPPAGE